MAVWLYFLHTGRSLCLEAEWTIQGHSVAGRIRPDKKFDDLIGNGVLLLLTIVLNQKESHFFPNLLA
jgi:hypothetical protein